MIDLMNINDIPTCIYRDVQKHGFVWPYKILNEI